MKLGNVANQNWQIGDRVRDRYLGMGVVTQNTPQITILAYQGVRNRVEISGSQSSLERLGWQKCF